MTDTPAKLPKKRRYHSPEFKSHIVEACLQAGASVSRIALDHRLNTNMVRRWIKEADSSTTPAFVPLNPIRTMTPAQSAVEKETIHIRLTRQDSTVTIDWPSSQAEQCASWLRDFLS